MPLSPTQPKGEAFLREAFRKPVAAGPLRILPREEREPRRSNPHARAIGVLKFPTLQSQAALALFGKNIDSQHQRDVITRIGSDTIRNSVPTFEADNHAAIEARTRVLGKVYKNDSRYILKSKALIDIFASQDPQTLYELAKYKIKQGDLVQAEVLAKLINEKEIKDKTLECLIREYMQAENLKSAERIAGLISTVTESRNELLRKLAYAYYYDGNLKGAERITRLMRPREFSKDKVLEILAKKYSIKKEFKEAKRIANLISRELFKNYILAEILINEGDLQQAEIILNSSEFYFDSAKINFGKIAKAYIQTNDLVNSKRIVDLIINRWPRNAKLFADLTAEYICIKNLPEAERMASLIGEPTDYWGKFLAYKDQALLWLVKAYTNTATFEETSATFEEFRRIPKNIERARRTVDCMKDEELKKYAQITIFIASNELQLAERLANSNSDYIFRDHTLTIIAKAYVRDGRIEQAKRITILSKNESFKKYIEIYILIASGKLGQAATMANSMEGRSARELLAYIAQAYFEAGKLQEAEKILLLLPHDDSYRSRAQKKLLDRYILESNLLAAEKVALFMPSKAHKKVAWTTIAAAYLKSNNLHDAERILLLLPHDESYRSTVRLLKKVAQAYIKKNELDKAEKVALLLKEGHHRDSVLVCIIKFYVKFGHLNKAERIADLITGDDEKRQIVQVYIAANFLREAKRIADSISADPHKIPALQKIFKTYIAASNPEEAQRVERKERPYQLSKTTIKVGLIIASIFLIFTLERYRNSEK